MLEFPTPKVLVPKFLLWRASSEKHSPSQKSPRTLAVKMIYLTNTYWFGLLFLPVSPLSSTNTVNNHHVAPSNLLFTTLFYSLSASFFFFSPKHVQDRRPCRLSPSEPQNFTHCWFSLRTGQLIHWGWKGNRFREEGSGSIPSTEQKVQRSSPPLYFLHPTKKLQPLTRIFRAEFSTSDLVRKCPETELWQTDHRWSAGTSSAK